MTESLPVTERLIIPAADLAVEVSRSGGPGGQHVNKTESRVRLRFQLDQCAVLRDDVKRRIRKAYPGQLTADGELLVVATSHRSQHRNIEEARERLAQLIRGSLRAPKRRRPTRPTRASKERRIKAKKRRSAVKQKRKTPRGDE